MDLNISNEFFVAHQQTSLKELCTPSFTNPWIRYCLLSIRMYFILKRRAEMGLIIIMTPVGWSWPSGYLIQGRKLISSIPTIPVLYVSVSCLLLSLSLFISYSLSLPIYLYLSPPLLLVPSPFSHLKISLNLSSRMSEEMWHHLFSWNYRLILLLILTHSFFFFSSLLFQKTPNLPVLLLDQGIEWYYIETASDPKLLAFWKNDDFCKSTSRQ